jgi:hypothetical protein
VHWLISTAIVTVVFLELFLVALWIAVGAGRERRSHFWVRLLLACLAVPALVAATGFMALNVLSADVAKVLLPPVFLCGVAALMLVPGLLYRGSGSSPGPSDSDGGGGSGPRRPPRPPESPRGGIPLPDADQARTRARDHSRPRFDRWQRRRPVHRPARKRDVPSRGF